MKIDQNKMKDYTDGELSLLVWLGTFGNGSNRKTALGDRYSAVQTLVEKEASTGIYEPGGNNYDLSKLIEAVKKTYSDAAENLIDEIKKETK